MADVQITRVFNTTAERLFKAVTQQTEVLNWWGYDGMTFPSCALDFSRTGPWHSVMISSDGTRYSLSGQVTKVVRPNTVSFTWAWHGEADQRGAESHVTFSIDDLGTGQVRLTIDHRDLGSEEIATRHEAGWTSGPIPRLERYVAALTPTN